MNESHQHISYLSSKQLVEIGTVLTGESVAEASLGQFPQPLWIRSI
ncbi:hypothetical protein SAMN04488137_3167 [Fictibacillus solisalsi]|uniref:Uncharacterized protein n=1 Tax=Fictibacillus solisalsi TaxID=459525 RepID=A0A1G9Y2G9_9BACL|nr:hypothetical protein SAMN04488137_3167 [Fictibacillus solisalsi]